MPQAIGEPRVLVVVPTLGERLEYLRETLMSIRAQNVPTKVAIVVPVGNQGVADLGREFQCELVADPGSLPGAINKGVRESWGSEEFVTWLNDDDLLEPGSLAATMSLLERDPMSVCAYGACRYIDDNGRFLWLNKAGPWANRILSWGPDLIPQPGMLVRFTAWQSVGGLNEAYRFAFDLDLLLRLREHGRLSDTGVVVSSFRWHADSLTVGDRTQSLTESERAKRAAMHPTARKFAWLWEGPVRIATRIAARQVSARALRAQRVPE